MRVLDDLCLSGAKVLVRVDLNVPMTGGEIRSKSRINLAAPTIMELADKGAKVIVLAHFGRPKGQFVSEMSLAPLVGPLSEVLDRSVSFVTLNEAMDAVGRMVNGDILLLENLRFYPGEEDNKLEFAKRLAALGDIYVNDAFSCAHRSHASTEALAHLLPAAAGRSMQAEIAALNSVLANPGRPVAALVGGAKVSTKLDVLANLLDKVDQLIIGGGMANTFLFAKGFGVGISLCQRDLAATARDIMDKARTAGCEIVLPIDVVVAHAFKVRPDTATVPVEKVPDNMMILDVGPASVRDLTVRLSSCKTLLWNGPMGAFEISPFDEGTVRVAQAAARQTKASKLISIAGGGDTAAALSHAGTTHDFTYVSMAGGAFLEWLEGKDLPGIKALEI